jgi:hypothetical protein
MGILLIILFKNFIIYIYIIINKKKKKKKKGGYKIKNLEIWGIPKFKLLSSFWNV